MVQRRDNQEGAMNSKVSYHQQVSYCGKPRCKRCREGVGHGPYWYSYQTVDGRTTRTYVGKHLPPEAQAAMGVAKLPPTAQEAEREQSTLRIYALGQFRLERRNPRDPLEWQTVTDAAWQHQRVRALLGCMVSVGGRKLTREQIMDSLWPDLDIETAASRLDRSVYSLRQLFEPTRNKPASSPLLLTEREVLVLADHPQIWIDADAFENLITRANESKDVGQKESLLREAANLYGGPFLPEDSKNEWTRTRRETLQRSWIGLLLELADLQIAREALTGAIDPLDRLLSIDPTNEAAVQRLMSLLAQLGRRGEALRAYKRLHTALQQEYRIAPLPETRALYDTLRTGREVAGKGAFQKSEATNRDTAARAVPVGPGGTSEIASVQIGRPHQSPLVGRERELEHLTSLVKLTEQAAKFRLTAQKRVSAATLDPHRRPQCVMLMGDVGIGKTRLAEEMGREAKQRGWAVAWSRVYAQEGTIPYRLWSEVLPKAMVQGVWQRQEISRRPILFQSLSNLLPGLQEVITPVNYSTSVSPEQEQLRLWEAVKELLILISESTPLLIALDDLQWADSSSCDLLAYLARRLHGYPIVIVCTCRDMELPQDHPLRPLLTDLRRENAIESLPLEPLSQDQIASLVTQVTQVSEPMVQRISTRAGGNPFFAEELARTLETEPTLADTLIGKEQDPLPDTINAVLTLRMGRLSQDCQSLLKKAAVLGSSFEFQVISAMEESGSNYDEDAVLELIEEALKSGMLTEEGTGTRVTYSFWHPLLASHLYESLSAARRASQHRRAAEVFKKLYAGQEEDWAATITNHLVRGGADSKQIVHYAELAGNRAFSLSSYQEAEKYYRITLEYIENNSVDWQRLSYILELLAECTRIQGKHEEALHFYEQSLGVRGQKHSNDSSIDPLQEAQLQAILWSEIANTWYGRGDLVRAKQFSERSEKVLRDTAIVEGAAWAYQRFIQGYIYWREGNYDAALHSAKEALDLFTKAPKQENRQLANISYLTRTRRTLVGDSVDLGRTYVLVSNVKTSDGQGSDGLQDLNKALAIFEQYDCTREIAIVSCNLGDRYLRIADYTQAQAALRRSFSVAERMGDVPLLSFVVTNLGLLDLRLGNLNDAEAEFHKAIKYAENVNDPIFISWWYSYLATTLQEQGKLSEARVALHNALSIGHRSHVALCIGLALVVLGQLRLAQAKNMKISIPNTVEASRSREHILKRAKKTLQHALTFNGLEADARIEGRLALAQTYLLLNEATFAYEQAEQALEEAQQSELNWLVVHAQRILGSIFATLGNFEYADQHFEQALRTLRRSNMRLEYARTLRDYGIILLQRNVMREKEYERGLSYLLEAVQMFEQCKAELDLQAVQAELVKYEPAAKGA